MTLIEAYLPLIFVGLICMDFAPMAWLVSRLIRPKGMTKLSEETYECGSIPIGEARSQFRFQYYTFALIFLVFDLVATFLFIMVVAFGGLSQQAIYSVLLLLGILLLAVVYSLKKEGSLRI